MYVCPLRDLPLGSVVRFQDGPKKGTMARVSPTTRKARRLGLISVTYVDESTEDHDQSSLVVLVYGPMELGRRALLSLSGEEPAQAQLAELTAEYERRLALRDAWLAREVTWGLIVQHFTVQAGQAMTILQDFMRQHGSACLCSRCDQARTWSHVALRPEALDKLAPLDETLAALGEEWPNPGSPSTEVS